jgi:hypothetical protein
MTTNNLNFGTDGQGRNAYAPNVSNLIYRALIGQNVAQSITLPSDTGVLDYEVCFSYSAGSNIWVDYSGSPATVQHLQQAIQNIVQDKEFFLPVLH